MKLPFTLGNKLYQQSFWLYKPLYYHYKRYSDQDKIALLRNQIKPGMRVVDIGANIGFYTEMFGREVGATGMVYAFEPDKLNFSHLQKIAQNNIILENKAVGNSNERIKLYISDDMNVDHHTYDDGSGREYHEVQAVRIDDYLPDGTSVNVIKMDIQGYDYFAMLGMQETIKRADDLLLITEFWPYGLSKAGVDPNDFLELICELGMKYYTMDSDVLRPDDYDFEYYCDLICTK